MVRMERRHRCKLCSRRFSSGRALGGHMRSHLANLPLPPKTQQKQETNQQQQQLQLQLGGDDSAESTTSSDCSLLGDQKVVVEKESLVNYGLRENPKKSFRLVDPHLQVVQDREGESSESTRKPTRRRSKRTRRLMKPSSSESLLELEPVSSTSDTSPEEDLALCLIMLSRDVWRTTISSDNSQQEIKLKGKASKVRDKKIKIDHFCEENLVSSIKNVVMDKKVHECPFCGKVFGSGQALGGHKRSHFFSSFTPATTTTTLLTTTTASAAAADDDESLLVESSNSAKFQQGLLMIDLNLPAPMEDEDEDFCIIQKVSAKIETMIS
ncbi:hypothetical protein ACH5RR_040226 [Cinchona calisaya]|uniref:C2H2-type domain-containing protein n=1 Tax=Cinchona calisaya TaxID=153742 RepID=A0ABD2XWF6_9GENT